MTSRRRWNTSPGRDVGYPPSRPTAIARCTASLREEAPSLRYIELISELAVLRETNSLCVPRTPSPSLSSTFPEGDLDITPRREPA